MRRPTHRHDCPCYLSFLYHNLLRTTSTDGSIIASVYLFLRKREGGCVRKRQGKRVRRRTRRRAHHTIVPDENVPLYSGDGIVKMCI